MPPDNEVPQQDTASLLFLLWNVYHESSHKETSANHTMRDVLHDGWPVIIASGKIKKEKQRLRNCSQWKESQRAMGLPWLLSSEASACQYRRWGLSPWARKIPWRRQWKPFQCSSCLGNPMDRGAGWATAHGVTKSWTWLID